jgi:hypothetical protein
MICAYGNQLVKRGAIALGLAVPRPVHDPIVRKPATGMTYSRDKAETAATEPGYRHPEYYDIALAVADVDRELDFFEAAIAKYSRVPVRRVFEIPPAPRPTSKPGTGAAMNIAGSS